MPLSPIWGGYHALQFKRGLPSNRRTFWSRKPNSGSLASPVLPGAAAAMSDSQASHASAHASAQSAPSQKPPKPHSGGRRKSPVWEHFVEPDDDDKKEKSASRRKAATCKYCGLVIGETVSKLDNLKKHIMLACPKAPREVKDSVAALSAADASATAPDVTRAGMKDGTPSILAHFQPVKTPPQLADVLNVKLLRWAVMSGIPFSAFDSIYWLDFLASARPGFVSAGPAQQVCCVAAVLNVDLIRADRLAGASHLVKHHLLQEYALVRMHLNQKLKESNNITVTGDGWTNACRESVMACNIITPQPKRAVHLLGARDLTTVKHDAQRLAGGFVLCKSCLSAALCGIVEEARLLATGVFVEWIKEVGPERVIALVTDNAANMKAARELVRETPGFVHIIPVRWAGGCRVARGV